MVRSSYIGAATGVSLALSGPLSSTAGDVNLKTITALTDADATLIGTQLRGGIFTITPSAPRILTTDTAVNIIAAMAGSVDGGHFEFTIASLAAFDATLTAGVGVTLVGIAVVNNVSGTWRVVRTSSTTVTMVRI